MVWLWLRRHPWLIDVLIVLGLTAVYVGRAVHLHRAALGVPFALLEVLPLLARRRAPRAVLAVVVAASLADAAEYSSFIPVAPAIAIYTTAAHTTSRRRSLVASAIAAAALAVTALAVDGYGQALSSLVLFGGAWVFGDSLGTRRAYTKELEEKNERLEREQAAQAARAVAEEQARIGRELHDVIAHSMSVIVVQAAAANDVFAAAPERARQALREIEATGRSTLAELRRLLGAVRGDGAEYAPQPGLDQVDTLVAQVRAAGLEVAVSVEGEPRALPAALDLSAYRIVQEALTNTVKHAHATRADVALRFGETTLDVEVRDNGRGEANGSGNGAGHGLIGMRERVNVFGGSLETGPAPGGGFAVAARFPLEART
jgi:signal transduction histidine kinase